MSLIERAEAVNALARYFRVDCGEHAEDARQYATDILKEVLETDQPPGAVKALEAIRREGKVCDAYETCEHRACQSSYAAWSIADEYLRGGQ